MIKELKIKLSNDYIDEDCKQIIITPKDASIIIDDSGYFLADVCSISTTSYFQTIYIKYDDSLINISSFDPCDIQSICCLTCEGRYLLSLGTPSGSEDIYLSTVTPLTDGSDYQYVATLTNGSTVSIDLSSLPQNADKYVNGVIPNPAGSGTGSDGLYLFQFSDLSTIPVDFSALVTSGETLTSLTLNTNTLTYIDENLDANLIPLPTDVLTTLTILGNQLTYTDELGAVNVINLPDDILTSLTLLGNTLTYTDELGFANVINLPTYYEKVIDAYIENPADTDEIHLFQVPDSLSSITINKIRAYAGPTTATVDFNIEERTETTPDASGVDVFASEQTADNDGIDITSFSNSSLASGTHSVLTVSSTANTPLYLKLQVQFTEVV